MKPRLLFITIALIIMGSVAVAILWPTAPDYSFDNSPNVIVIQADVEINSGAPRAGEICRYPSVPVLRIWGDGVVFLYDFDFQDESTSLYKGRLSEQEFMDLINFLKTEGFWGNWTPDGASPAANYLHVGIRLKHRPYYQRTFATLPPSFYTELEEMLKPKLGQFVRGQAGESRIDSLNHSRECVTPTP